MTEEGMTENVNEHTQGHLLGAADIRRIAADAGISPTKKFGQNFVIDPGTVRRIVREAGVTADDHVLEVGPGLGSLTLAILETGATMTAVEIDPPVAERLPKTIAEFMPDAVDRFRVVNRDALTVNPENLPDFKDDDSFTLVANLPYNVATPILLTLLERFDNLGTFLVMVQKEVADRLSEKPGSKIYGTPSVKLAWYGTRNAWASSAATCSGRPRTSIPRWCCSSATRAVTPPPRTMRTVPWWIAKPCSV